MTRKVTPHLPNTLGIQPVDPCSPAADLVVYFRPSMIDQEDLKAWASQADFKRL